MEYQRQHTNNAELPPTGAGPVAGVLGPLSSYFGRLLDTTRAALVRLGGLAVLLFNPRRAAAILWRKQHTTLTHARGSEGMGLPAAMKPETVDIIAATAPVVAPKA